MHTITSKCNACDMVCASPTPVSFIKLTVTISPAPCKIKLDASTFLFAILRGCRGLSRITVSTYELQPQRRYSNCLYYTPYGALHCKYHINYCQRDVHPLASYTVQAVCQGRNQSRVRVRVKSVRAASSNNAAI